MGGTTAKASLIEDGRVSRSQEYEVGAALSAGSRLLRGSGELIRIPTIDIAEVGAGGGSLAWLDPAGAPPGRPAQRGRRARARPATASAARSPPSPTRTSCSATSRRARSPRAISPFRLSGPRAAFGRVAEPLGARALRGGARHPRPCERADDARAPRRLHRARPRPARLRPRRLRRRRPDPRRRAGGRARCPHRRRAPAGRPLLVRRPPLRAHRVPRRALLPDRRARCPTSRSWRARGRDAGRCRAREGPARSNGSARPTSATAGRTGASPSTFPARSRASRHDALIERFEAEHERLYGTRLEPGSPVEIRALRLTVVGPPAEGWPRSPRAGGRSAGARRGSRTSARPTGARDARPARAAIGTEPRRGPLLVDEYDTTVVVPPDWTVASAERSARARARPRSSAPRRRGRQRAGAILRPIVGERARHRRGRDGDDDLPHRPLGGRPRRDGLLGRALRADRRDDRAGRDDPAPARLDPERDERRCSSASATASRRATSTWSTTRSTERATRPTSSSSSPPSPATELIGFGVSVAHHADVGGRVPGTIACDSTDVFQEGLRIPWVKLYDRGRAGRQRSSGSSARTSACRTRRSATSTRRSPRARSASADCRSSPRATAPTGSAS